MVTSITKDALYPGEWGLSDGRTFICQPEDIPHYAKRMKDWIKAGLQLPIRWEHQLNSSPAEKAKQTISHVDDASNAGEYVEIKFSLDDQDDVKKLPKVKYVSPTIEWDKKDQNGRVWPGPTITEIALTPIPIQNLQKPFKLSRDDRAVLATAPIYLSMAERRPLKLGAAAMADETPPVAEETPAATEATPVSEEDQEAVGLAEKLKVALAALQEHGLILGSDMREDALQFLDRLIAALKTKKAAENPMDANAQSGQAGTEQPTEVQSPMQMSRGMAKLYRESAESRIKMLWMAKKIPKRIHDDLLNRMKAVKLSQAKDGEPIDPAIIHEITAYEALDAGTPAFQRKVDLSGATEVEPGDEAATKEASEKRQQEAGSVIGAMANGKMARPPMKK